MYISSKQKAAIAGVVAIAVGGAAFVYFDPLDMDLLGLNPPAVQPVYAPRPPVSRAPVQPAIPPAPEAIPEAVPVQTPVQVDQPPLEMSNSLRSGTSKPAYPPSTDLRHCLDQPTPQDIAKCAGE